MIRDTTDCRATTADPAHARRRDVTCIVHSGYQRSQALSSQAVVEADSPDGRWRPLGRVAVEFGAEGQWDSNAIIEQTPAASRVMASKGRKMVSGDRDPKARLSQHLKDVQLIVAAAEREGGNCIKLFPRLRFGLGSGVEIIYHRKCEA